MCIMFKSHGMRPKPFSDVNVRSVGRCIVAYRFQQLGYQAIGGAMLVGIWNYLDHFTVLSPFKM